MKTILVILFAFILSLDLLSQDITDPYIIYKPTTINPTIPAPFVKYLNSADVYNTDDNYRGIPDTYVGEYVISLRNLHWAFDWSQYPGPLNPMPVNYWMNPAKTYKTEIVSFPFTCNCYKSAIGCAPLG